MSAMKGWMAAAFTTMLLGAFAPGKGSGVSDVTSVRKTLQAKYAGFARAFQKKDSRYLGSTLTQDFTVKQPGGRMMTREQVIAGFKQQMAAMSDVKWPRRITKLIMQGGDAVADVDGHFAGKTTGQDGKPHEFVMAAASRDTWTKLGNAWKLKRSEVLRTDASIDGKPVRRRGGQERRP